MTVLGSFQIRKETLSAVAAAGFALAALSAPFSSALLNIGCIGGFIFWLISLRIRDVKRLAARPTMWVFAAFVFFLSASILWTSAPLSEALGTLSKYRKLLYCPAILCLCLTWPALKRQFFILGYVSLFLLSLCSVAVALHVPGFPAPDPYQGAIFMKSHITEGFLLGIFTLMNGCLLLFDRRRAMRLLGVSGLVLAFVVVFYLTNGRTGFLSLTIAFLVIGCYWIENKRQVFMLMAALIVAAALIFSTSDRVHSRITEATDNVVQYVEQGNNQTSMGLRLSFWTAGLEIFVQSPLVGQGLGSVKTEMSALAQKQTLPGKPVITANPHNDFILIAAQTGLIGLSLWFVFLWRVYRFSSRFSTPAQLLLRGLLALYVTGALFNSYLLDLTEGTVFVLALGVLLSIQDRKVLKEDNHA